MKRLLFDTDVKAIRDAKLRGNYPNIHCENDLIDAVPTADLSELWIPVTERLPERGTVALVWDGTFRKVARLGKWGWHEEYLPGDENGGKFVDGVTHWMPLPESPKKEAENT